MIHKKLRLLILLLCLLTGSLYGYKVEKGDTLSGIAAKNGMTLSALLELNGFDKNTVIKTGQTIKLSADEKTAVSKGGEYKVKSGDTLSGIAAKNGMTLNALLELNGFDKNTVIKTGQTIKLSGAANSVKTGSSSYDADYSKLNVKFAKKQEIEGNKNMTNLALSLVGTRYISGGTSRGGFDCSGLTKYIYAQSGISIPRTAREQAVWGTAVKDVSQLQKGDLVLFSIHGSGVDHVGMYVGSGEFVHAANSRRGVRIDKLSSDYYSKCYVGARRAK